MKYEVISKIGEITVEDLENKISKKLNVSKGVIKLTIIGALTIAFSAAFSDSTFAAETTTMVYKKPTELGPIFDYIDWLIMMARIIVSSVVGLIATYAGYLWSTTLSPQGATDAKKILLNCAKGIFWVQFGATIAHFFVDKLQHLVS